MNIFEDLEMEFFDPRDEEPKSGEEVIIILKDKVPNVYYRSHPSGLIQCIFRKYKSVPAKFERYECPRTSKFTIGQVRCWGRLKIKQIK